MSMIDDVSALGDMIGRNPKVALELMPSAIPGYVMNGGKQDTLRITSGHAVHYDWTYENTGNPEFKKLYRRAYKAQWDAEDLPWTESVDTGNLEKPIFPEKYVPGFGQSFYPKDKAMRETILHSTISWMLSQFLHGLQARLVLMFE